jgi:hypothetical protein
MLDQTRPGGTEMDFAGMAPITSTIGFVEGDCEVVSRAYLDWMGELNLRQAAEPVRGDLRTVLGSLLPLDNFRARRLFVPTRGPWTAYFDNHRDGTDLTPLSVMGQRAGGRAVRATAVPHTLSKKNPRGQYGAVVLQVWGPDGNSIRAVWAANDGGRWTFGQIGEPFPFERVDRYAAKTVRERFTPEMLSEYLRALSIPAFEEAFYDAGDRLACLVRRQGPLPDWYREFGLEEVRAGL